MAHHYCTYFHENYLPRALLLIDSLRAHGAPFRLHVLCLSDACARLLERLAIPEVTIIELGALEARFPELLAVKNGDRTPIEYIFTLSPCLPAYCLAQDPTLTAITYLDCDLYFYADPQLVFDHIGDASVAIVAHRFSPAFAEHAVHGTFNVGWVTFRATPEGRACLEDWKASCLDWCYDRVEDGRYADQGYLDGWPARYPNLKIVTLKGANVARWNVDNYAVSERDGVIWCDDERLIFYHFHGVYAEPTGTHYVLFPETHRPDGVVVRRLYHPYVAQLTRATHGLHRRFAGVARDAGLSRYGSRAWPPPSGWSDDRITQARAIRAIDHQVQLAGGGDPAAGVEWLADVAAALRQAAGPEGRVSVLDWGGGLGEYARSVRRLLPDLAIDYEVAEVSTVCDYARALFDDVTFIESDEAGGAWSSRRYDVVLAIDALHYVRNWGGVVRQLGACARRSLLLAGVPTVEKPSDRVFPERPLRFLPRAMCLASAIHHAALHAELGETGLTLAHDLRPWRSAATPIGPLDVSYRSLVFARAAG